MRKLITFFLMVLLLPVAANAQRIQQKMDRSVVAATRDNNNVLVTWRKFAQDPDGCTYNLYKRSVGATAYVKVNTTPITKTNFSSTMSVIPLNTELAVTSLCNGNESAKSDSFVFKKQAYPNVFVDIDFETKVLNPNDYKVKYVWPVDLNGDGLMNEFIIDRLYAVTDDNDNVDDSTKTATAATQHKLQAYTSTGKCLWTIDMGPNVNIDAGQNDMVLAYDINCDGKAEVIIKSSDGTRFWDSTNNTWGKYVFGGTNPDTDGDGLVDYCVSTNTKRNPPFYVSVINGMTGEEITSAELDYSQVHDGVDSYSRDNRSDYMNNLGYYQMGGHFAICYFDGIHPSLAMECLDRTSAGQTHHNYVFAFGYDWNGSTPSNFHHYYTWSRNDKTPWPAEFHQLRVCDVDGDGIDEMLQGGYGVNTKKGMVFSAGIGHGDRYRVSDIDPERPGLETFAIQQSDLLGELLYDAATGEHIKELYLSSVADVGRGECMDVDSTHKGYEFYSTMANLYDCKGHVIKAGDTPFPYEGIWWNGDLAREVLSSPGGKGYASNVMLTTYGGSRLAQFSSESSWITHAGPAVRAAFIGDMTGDWREEVILMKQNSTTSTGIVGYTTNYPTDYSLYCLQEDPHYRLDCTTRGYYQSPNTDFYLGYDMPNPPMPADMVADLRWKSGSAWSASGSGFTSFDMGKTESYADAKSVIFDISGDNASAIAINGTLKPGDVYVMSPKGHDYTFGGTGTLSGTMNLYKSMQGTATFDNNMAYTGKTVVSEGRLNINGTVAGPVSLLAKGTLGGNATLNGDVTFEGALNYEGCRLMPGTDDNKYGVITFGKSITIPGNVYIEENLTTSGTAKCGKIAVKGDLTFKGTNTFTINSAETKPAAGSYVLAECSGTLTVDTNNITIRNLNGVAYYVSSKGGQLLLVIEPTRDAANGVVWTGSTSSVWDYRTKNFAYNNAASTFVSDDQVVFGNDASQRAITINEKMVTNGVTFNFDDGTYTLGGDGAISGDGGVTKSGKGELIVNMENNDYTGATVVKEGTLTVSTFADAGKASSIGASSSDASNLQIYGGATLKLNAYNMATNHSVTLPSDTATVNISNASGSLSLNGIVTGNGYLIKTGAGQLNFNYAGENPFAGVILKQGMIAQGDRSASFGKVGSPMILAGGSVSLVANTTFTVIPCYDYVATVVDGTSNIINGSFRSYIKGSFSGSGTLTINSGGERCDIFSDFSKFAGTVNAGGSWRLINATDLSKAAVVMATGSSIGHYTSGSYTTVNSLVSKFGSLASAATDATVAYGSYETGYNNQDATFAGLLNATQVTKYGTGKWILTNSGSTANLIVRGGILDVENGTSNGAVSTNSIRVYADAQVAGTGETSGIILYKGATMGAGKNQYCGTLTANGNVTAYSVSTILCKVNAYTNGKFVINGNIVHGGDTIRLQIDAAKSFNVGDQITLFTVSGTHKGTFVIDGGGYAWDSSTLLTDGKLKVAKLPDGIKEISADKDVDVYTTDGFLLRKCIKYKDALEGLKKGIYIVDGIKVVK